mmetsp:Transcript_776/g.1266  ORF Transcript_776/g.1266 Transcript_776/m.1266 type:complete len:80 (-) Transcript_776:3344-3583(-)
MGSQNPFHNTIEHIKLSSVVCDIIEAHCVADAMRKIKPSLICCAIPEVTTPESLSENTTSGSSAGMFAAVTACDKIDKA